MGRVIHFEIHAQDPERAVKFYTAVFGWEMKKWDGPMEYWLVMTGDPQAPGINGGLLRRHGPPPNDGQAVNAYVCTIEVPSADATAAAVTANGGTIVVPKMAIPGLGWLFYFKDTEGNIFGAMHHDPNAK
jgi:predicted enzyme related to lactoylglutathione lyase